MSISFNDLNGPNVSDASGNTTLGSLSSQNPNGQNLNNTAVGFGALRDNAGGQHNIAVGLNALANNSASNNVAIGENALYNFLAPSNPQTGTLNVAVGNNAMQSNASGNQNVAVGNQALHNNTTGSYNAVVGNGAAYYNTTGQNNAVLGANALLNNTTGTQNVAIGKEALQSSQTTTGNVAVGHHALKNHITGNGNIGIGNHALIASTTGSNNVGIGSGVSANNNDSCILLGNGAQTVASNEIGVGGINLAAPPSPAPPITGYLPVRMSNSTLSNKLYYVPMYDPAVPSTLPIPEVIVANHSSLGPGKSGGVALLIGFPSDYSVVTSVTIVNPKHPEHQVVINSPISTSGYYVYYEDQESGFWSSLPSSYSNLVPNPTYDDLLCNGMSTGFPLSFTYLLSGVSTNVRYQPTPSSQLDIGNGYQYEKYLGSGSPQDSANGFQWGRKPGGGGSEAWGTQTGSGTQTYAQWQAVASDYQYNSIYKYLYPYSTVSGPPGPGPTSASMAWPVTKSLSSIANGATCTIGGTGSTDIPVPTITGATGTAPTIVYSISSDSNMPSITLSGSTLTVVWDSTWSTSLSTGLSTNAIIIATATVQGTLTSAYLTTVLTVGSSNTLTWAFSPYTQLTAPTLYAIPAALTFSASPPYYTNTAAFTVTNTYTNVAITSTGASSAVTSNGVTTITPQTAGYTIITATSSTGSGKTRTLLTISAPQSMTWQVTKTLSSIASGATYTIGGTDIPAPTTIGVTGTITYSISSDSNTPSITTSGTNGATLTAVWANWGAPANGIQTNAIITATQGTIVAYLNVVITVNTANVLTWTFSPYNLLTAPIPYTVLAALTFSQVLDTYYTNTAAFTVATTYTNVAITSSAPSVASATTTSGTTTIAPSNAGSTIITATSTTGTGKTRILLTIVAPAGPTLVAMYSQMTNPTLISPALAVAPNILPPSQQFIANEFGSDISGIIDHFFLPLIKFTNVSSAGSVPFTMTLAKNGTTLVTTTFSLPGNAGTDVYTNGINIPFLSQSAASNTPQINFTFNPASPTGANTTITNLDQITISLNATSTITGGTWQIKMSGGEMAGTVFGTSTPFVPLTVPAFTPASLSTTFADVVYIPNLEIPISLVSSNTITPLIYTITPSSMGTISTIVNGGTTSYRFNAASAGIATITFAQAPAGKFSNASISGTIRVLATPTIAFTSVVNSQMTYAIGVPPIALNDASKPAATSSNANAAIAYTLTGVSNIAGTTTPCAKITTTGTGASTTYTLNLLGVGSFTLVASQLATLQTTPPYGPGTASLLMTIVSGSGPSNLIELNTIVSNASTAPFVMDLLVNSMNSVSMSYTTNINAVVSYFNIPTFNVNTNGVAGQPVSFTLTVYRGTTNIPVSTTNFTITTNQYGVYSPTGGITVPLSPQVAVGQSGYMPITLGVTGISNNNAGQTQLYAIQSPPTAYSISTTSPNILIVLTPSTNYNYGSVTVDVNANGPNNGMLGTLYGYIQLLSPTLTFGTIPTPITWSSSKQVSFNPATSSATDGISLTYASSNTNVATIPVTTTNSMTLTATKPTNPTNIITISASRAATATYSQQTVSMNPTTTPPTPQYPICIKTYALTNAQKIAYTNPISQLMSNVANQGTLYITFIASESFTSLDSLNFAINGGRYGYSNMFPTDVTPYFQIQISINDQPSPTIITFTTNGTAYDSDLDGTLREIPFSQLENYPTKISNFSVTGTPPSCVSGDKIKISIFCNVNWFISANGQGVITSTIVGTPSIPSASYPLPKILYMTSSSNSIASSSVNSNSFFIFKKSVITSFQVAGVKPQGQFQSFYLNTNQNFYSASVGYSIYVSLSIAFTYDFGANYATTFSSIQIPFSNIEYSRLYPTSNPPMTSFTIAVGTNSGGAQSVPTPFLFNISDQFTCTLVAAVSGQQFTANVLGNSMSGSIYGYEILSNPNLRNFNTLITPLNYLSTNYNKPIPPPGTDMSSPTFTYSVTSNGGVAIGTGANSNNLVLSNGYCNATVTVVESETNQYYTSALSQNVDIISRTMLPPNTYSMTTISQASAPSNFINSTVYQYVNVLSYEHPSPPVSLYGYGFFNIGSSDTNSYYSTSNVAGTTLNLQFQISKYVNNSWIAVRTIGISYKTGVVNSNDDGSLFIIPFYNAFSNGAPTNLPFTHMPSNVASLTVNSSDSSDINLPPTFNVGDTLQFTLSTVSVNLSPYFPIDQYSQLSGTVLSSIYTSYNYAPLINGSYGAGNGGTSYYPPYNSNIAWNTVTVSPTIQSSFNSLPYSPPNNLILTGIFIYPMNNVPANTNFTITVYLQSNMFITIYGTTNVAGAFDNYTSIWLTRALNLPNQNITITNIAVRRELNYVWLNKGLANSQTVSTNPWVQATTSIFFQITFTNLPSSAQIGVLNYTYSSTVYNNIPGVFYGRLL